MKAILTGFYKIITKIQGNCSFLDKPITPLIKWWVKEINLDIVTLPSSVQSGGRGCIPNSLSAAVLTRSYFS
jgi:hypothetical protein